MTSASQPPSAPLRVRRRRRRRHPKTLIALGLAALLLLLSGVTAMAAQNAASGLESSVAQSLRTGAAELQAGKDAVKKATADSSAAELQQAGVHFDSARAHFLAAARLIDGSRLLKTAGGLPGAGSYVRPRVRAVDELSAMGVDLCAAGQLTAQADSELIKSGAPSQSAGARVIAVLNASLGSLPAIEKVLKDAQLHADAIDPSVLPAGEAPTLAKAKDSIRTGIATAEELTRLAPVLVDVLGGNGARNFLVLQVDPAELRGGGGFIGSYSILTTRGGGLSLGSGGDIYDIDHPYPLPGQRKFITPPAALYHYFNHGWVLGDANFYPDFPTDAAAAERLLANETGRKVDGVISLDPWTVAALLQVTGPISIPEYSTTVDAATFPEAVFQREETAAANVAGRKLFFPAVADRILTTVSTLPSGRWSQLLSVLNQDVSQRHLQVYLNSAADESEIGRLGWSGALAGPGSGQERLLAVEANYGANKANHFLARQYDLTLSVSGGVLHHKLVITDTNSTPRGYLGGQRYLCFLRFYYPAGATGGALQGTSPVRSDESEPGYQVLDGQFVIQVDSATGRGVQTVTIEYDTPAPDLKAPYLVYWQKEAGTLQDPVAIHYLAGGKTLSGTTDLAQDRVIRLTATGFSVLPGNTGSAQLPILG